MKLVITITSYPPSIGGAQIHMHKLACELQKNHQINVITQWDRNRTDWLFGTTFRAEEISYEYTIDGISVHRLGFTKKQKISLFPWALFYPLLQGLSIHQIANIIYQQMISYVKNADIIHNCRIGREGISYASLQLARKLNIPFVLTPVHHPRWTGWFYRYYNQLYRCADAVIALTHAEKHLLASMGVDENRIHVTGTGPLLAEYGDGNRFRVQYRLGENPIVLFLGQKYPYKGIRALLDSMKLVHAKYPDTRFVFIGPRTDFSQRIFHEYHSTQLVELGSVDLQEKTDALAACTLLCVPSTQESFGGVYTEAWSMGKPVIGCRIPAVTEVIDHGINGLLVKQDPIDIADKIIAILSSPTEAVKMGKNGQEKVEKNYTWQILASKTEKIYQNLWIR